MNAPSQPSLFAIDNIINDVQARISMLEGAQRKANKDLWVVEIQHLYLQFVDVEKRKAVPGSIERASQISKREALLLNGRYENGNGHKCKAYPVVVAYDNAIEQARMALKALIEARAKSVDNSNKA